VGKILRKKKAFNGDLVLRAHVGGGVRTGGNPADTDKGTGGMAKGTKQKRESARGGK